MKSFDNILRGREERAEHISRYLVNHEVVISLKANIPGDNKNIYLAYLIINAFSFLVKEFNNNIYDYNFNDDGPYLIIPIKFGKANLIKSQTVNIEETHPLGRFVDIDIYTKNENISRNKKRSCYLCSNLAAECIREKKHSFDELIEYIKKNVDEYYSDILYKIVDESILHELNLHPKFGLVTPKTSGSHKDMDYTLMLKAKDAILPYFIRLFFFMLDKEIDDNVILSLKTIGLKAENAMLDATNNINAYKGLIFNLGIIITSFAVKISRYDQRSIFEISKDISYQLLKNIKEESNTFGFRVFQNYKFPGVRGETLSGFLNVQRTLKLLKSLSDHDKFQALVNLIINVEDSTLLKRISDIDEYKQIKEKFRKLNLNSTKEINELNQECIKKSLSFGGSADLLVLTVFIYLLNRDFYFIINID